MNELDCRCGANAVGRFAVPEILIRLEIKFEQGRWSWVEGVICSPL